MIPRECKRLAEVDFPIAAVSRHAAREKSIRHGHPSTLHLWWARRPLASSRAVLLALLLPDPCDPHCPEAFKHEARQTLLAMHGRPRGWSEEIETDEGLRRVLLKFIADFANWDNAAKQDYLDTGRALVKAAHGDEPPLVVDPFAGGGSIPLEALRLGCEAFASDLNPVACLILKVMLEDIPRHGPELADELRKVGGEIKRQAERELADLYPPDPDGATPIAYLWARTVRCEAPNCGAEIPLMRSFWLCRKPKRKWALRIVNLPGSADPQPAKSLHGSAGFQPAKSQLGSVSFRSAESLPGSAGFQPASSHGASSDAGRMPALPEPGQPDQDPRWHSRGYLPHFEGGETPQSITFRLHDSLPAALRAEWAVELQRLPEAERTRQQRKRIEAALDAGHGACFLAQPRIAALVADSLRRFDGKRYRLHAWCVMPNHVHVLVTPLGRYGLSAIVHAWKSFTAQEANRQLGRSGSFWMQEYFDRAIRDERHFRTAVVYIEHNHVQAGLCEAPEDWPWSSLGAQLSGPPGTNLGARASSPPKAEGSQGSDAGRMPALPGIAFEVFEPKVDSEVRSGTVTRAKATCLCCNAVLPPERVRAQLAAQKGGADVIFDAEGQRTGGARITAVVTLKPGQAGRHYRLPTDADYAAVRNAQERVARISEEWERGGKQGLCPIPDEPLPPIGTLGFRVQRYGMLRWGDLFTARQKAALVELGRQIQEMSSSDPASAQVAQAVLAMCVDKIAMQNSSSCRWKPSGESLMDTFGRHALPIVWDYAEADPFENATGSYMGAVEWVAKIFEIQSQQFGTGQVQPADATAHPLPDQSAGVWFTDPPYYDAIPYADLSDFFLVWLKRTLPGHPSLRDPFDPDNPLSPKQQEAVQDETRHAADQRNDGGTRVSAPLIASANQGLIPGAQASSLHHAGKIPALPDAAGEEGRPKDRAWFEETMAKAFAEGRRILAEDGVGSVVFAHKTTEGWEALLSGLIRGGWTITGSWPIATEMSSRLRARDSAALATSVHLICRPRPDDAPVGEWAEVLRELRLRVGDWMERLQAEGVRGADLVFACIGPALEIFSRYRSVETAEGREVELPEYLERVWEVVGRAALKQVLRTAEAKARNGLAGALEKDAWLTALFLWTLRSTGEGTSSANDSETDEDNGEGEEDDEAPRRKSAGFSLPFDVVRRFAQPLGIHLDHWEGRIVETSQGVVRLMSVAERSRQLFGEDGTGAAADWFERDPNADLQQALFPEPDAAPQTRTRLRGKQATLDAEFQTPDATTLDRVHAAMLLQASGRSQALRSLLRAEQKPGRDFLRLANAMSALYPRGSEEKRLLDAMLLAVPQ